MFGVLAIDKPAGITSRLVVSKIERLLRPLRVGHTGTLDPLATGVLLVAIGQATRLVEFSHLQSKGYEAEFIWGAKSPTLDTEGQVETLNVEPVDGQQIAQAAQPFVGKIQQIPPNFSAVHVDGKRAYDLARQGKSFEVPSREVEVHAIQVLECNYPRVRMAIDCGTGTYIRSLGSDIARELGSDAVMSGLVRTRIGKLDLNDCASMGDLDSSDAILRNLKSPMHLVDALPKITLSSELTANIRNGIPIELSASSDGPIATVDQNGELVAIVTRSGNRYRSLRVFQKTSDTHQPTMTNTPHNPES